MSKSKRPLNLADIKKAHGPKFLSLDVPEWGDGATVLAKRLSAPEYIELMAAKPAGELKGEAAYQWFLKMVQLSLVDESGSRLIGDEDMYLLADYPLMVTRLGGELLSLNGMGARPKNVRRTP